MSSCEYSNAYNYALDTIWSHEHVDNVQFSERRIQHWLKWINNEKPVYWKLFIFIFFFHSLQWIISNWINIWIFIYKSFSVHFQILISQYCTFSLINQSMQCTGLCDFLAPKREREMCVCNRLHQNSSVGRYMILRRYCIFF